MVQGLSPIFPTQSLTVVSFIMWDFNQSRTPWRSKSTPTRPSFPLRLISWSGFTTNLWNQKTWRTYIAIVIEDSRNTRTRNKRHGLGYSDEWCRKDKGWRPEENECLGWTQMGFPNQFFACACFSTEWRREKRSEREREREQGGGWVMYNMITLWPSP